MPCTSVVFMLTNDHSYIPDACRPGIFFFVVNTTSRSFHPETGYHDTCNVHRIPNQEGAGLPEGTTRAGLQRRMLANLTSPRSTLASFTGSMWTYSERINLNQLEHAGIRVMDVDWWNRGNRGPKGKCQRPSSVQLLRLSHALDCG